jgi:hypothetical protein
MEFKMKKSILLLSILLANTINGSTFLVKIKENESTKALKIVEKYRSWEESSSTFTDWMNFNIAYDFSLYLPEISSQTEDFSQNQTFKQDQQQFEQKRKYDSYEKEYENIGDPIETTKTLNLNNSREVTVIPEDWVLVGLVENCQAWSPLESSILFGQEFSQTRQCEQKRTRDISYYIDLSLETTLSFNETSLVVQDKQAFGSNSSSGWIITDSLFGDWEDVGEGYAHLEWSPIINNQLLDFSQSRSYSQDQTQTEQPREQNSFTMNYRNLGSIINNSQTISDSEDRNVIVAIGNFTNNNSAYDCINWTPKVETIVYGQIFEQNRDCQQNQIANISYKVDNLEIETGLTDKIITVNEKQSATGTNDSSGWITHTSILSDWVNDGSGYSHGNYLPLISSQEVSFSQSRSYSQNQTQNEQKREINTFTNNIRDIGAIESLEKTISVSESRNVSVSIGAWLDEGSLHSCGAWSPDVSTKVYGQAFTQTSACKQSQDAIITYKVLSDTIDTKTKSQNINKNKTQQATGTNDSSGWTTHTSIFSGWINSGSAYGHGTYAPAISSQSSNFNQSRSYYQKQKNNEQKREINTFTNAVRNSGSVIVQEQTLTKSESRTISVTNSGWVVSSGNYNCGGYSPSTGSIPDGERFLQTRDCDKNYTKTYSYKYGSTLLSTRDQTTVGSGGTSRYNYGTKDMSISATYGCPSGWTTSSNSGRCYTSVVPYNNGCPSGYIRTNAGHQCANYINMSYSCPSGYSLSGSRCYP